MSQVRKYTTLLSLYVAQAVPMSFFSTIVPVIMRQENYSLEAIGMLQLIKLPWIAKFMWAPLVDRHSQTLQSYKKWIFFSEFFYAIVILSIGFFNLQTDFTTIIVLMLIAFTASATQDIATDAMAIKVLSRHERSTGNSMQAAGTFIGTLTGSGVLLVIYHYFGWQGLLFCLAGFVIVALIPLYFYRTPDKIISETATKSVSTADISRFFKQQGTVRRVALLMLYYSGIIGILAMLKPFLVDLGYDVKTIGIMSGIFGTAMGCVSSFAAGWLIKRLGRRNSLFTFALFSLTATLYFLFLTTGTPTEGRIYLGIALIWSAYGMASVTIFTIAMDWVREGREGTDFTLQIVLTHLSSLIIAIASGKLADALGYRGLYLAEAALALLVVIAVPILYRDKENLELNLQS